MYVRRKKNRSGKTSVQVIDKSSGHYRVYHTVGCSDQEDEITLLMQQADSYIKKIKGQVSIDFILGDDSKYFQSVYDNIQQVQLLGPELVLGKIFDSIGFNAISDEMFRHLVLARLIYPVSKLKTLDYLQKYRGIVIEKDEVYRYLDKLHKEQMEEVHQISFNHTQKILGPKLSIVFYDVTTLYFEAEDEDDLRKTGFSKDGKHSHPQIVLGLLASEGGYPLDYEIFEGNKFEGHTVLPVIEAFKKKYQLENLIVVADSGLMSEKNINQLLNNGYSFIIGARIKNETQAVQQQILSLQLADGGLGEIRKDPRQRIIISYSTSRAKKDAHNRTKGFNRLRQLLANGKLSKRHINNKGYNKYLKLKGQVTITLDEEKYLNDTKWDGLKGYLTNTTLPSKAVIESYSQLWHIEKTFRISKTDLRIRPVYHYKRKRIEAHICIAFAACKVYKELERQLKAHPSDLSPEKAIEILKTIYGLTIQLPQSKDHKVMLLDKTQEQRNLLKLFYH